MFNVSTNCISRKTLCSFPLTSYRLHLYRFVLQPLILCPIKSHVLRWSKATSWESHTAVHGLCSQSLWIQPVYYECMSDCVNQMAGSWHGDLSQCCFFSTVGRGKLWALSSPPICAVLHQRHGVCWVSAWGRAAGTDQRDHVDTTHDPLRAGRGEGCPFFLTFSLGRGGQLGSIGQSHWCWPCQWTACIHTERGGWESRRLKQRQENIVEWYEWRKMWRQ